MYYLIGWAPDGKVYIILEDDNLEYLRFFKNREENSSGNYANDWQRLVIVREVRNGESS